jgi:hypothetical protein
MADTKLTALSEVSVPVLSDIAYWVADPAGTPASDKITASRLGGLLSPLYTTGRLTVVSGNAASIVDQASKGTLYYTAVTNDGTITSNNFQICIYDGTRLRLYSSAEISLALTLTSGKNYDVFIYDNSGTLTLELSAAWTNDTTRADALASQSGTVVKSGTTTRRWIGTIRASGTNIVDDGAGGSTGGSRFVWNAYNQVTRTILVQEVTTNWSYTSQTIRQARASSANQVQFVTGDINQVVIGSITCGTYVQSNSSFGARFGFGLDTITNFSTSVNGYGSLFADGYNADTTYPVQPPPEANFAGPVGLGYHYLSWNESGADGTCLFVSNGHAGIIVTTNM